MSVQRTRHYQTLTPACVPSSSRAIHTSAVRLTPKKSKQRIARERLEEKAKLVKGIPDYVLGHIEAEPDVRGRYTGSKILSSTWEGCRLAKCLIHPYTVWNSPLPDYANGEKPKHYLPGMSEEDKDFLFGALPHVTTALQYDPGTTPEIRDATIKEVMAEQEKQTEMLHRILDLRNASRAQINALNRRRILEEFGKGTDTGSSFVQGECLLISI